MSNPLMPVIGGALAVFVVFPVLKMIWEFLTREPQPKATKESAPIIQRDLGILEFADPNNPTLKWWKDNKPSFAAIETTGSEIALYGPDDIPKRLSSAIIDGQHKAGAQVHAFSKLEDGTWNTKTQAISDFAKSTFKLNVLYRPVWSYAIAGLKWGSLVGIALKLIDTAIGLLSVEPGAALCFAVAIAVCFIPRIGIIGMVIVSIAMSQFYRGNFFLMGISAALAGAILGCLPGMTLGGLIGLMKRNRLTLAPDAVSEDGLVVVKSTLLPFVIGATLFYLYFFHFNAWIASHI